MFSVIIVSLIRVSLEAPSHKFDYPMCKQQATSLASEMWAIWGTWYTCQWLELHFCSK